MELTLNLIQTIGVVGALLFTAYELRARRKEQRFTNYLEAMGGFQELSTLMIENPQLLPIFSSSEDGLPLRYEDLSEEQQARVHYCDLLIALCETIWEAHTQGWLPSDEWVYWKRWIHARLHGSSEFCWTVEWVRQDYGDAYIAEIACTHPARAGAQA